MRVLACLISGLSAVSAAVRPPSNEAQLSSLVAAGHAAESAALASAKNLISAERAGQTLSGAAASLAAHNSEALNSALSAALAESSIIAHAESVVLSQQSQAVASITAALATATGEDKSKLGSVLTHVKTEASQALSSLAAATGGGDGKGKGDGSGDSTSSGNLAPATALPIAAAAVGGGILAIIGLL